MRGIPQALVTPLHQVLMECDEFYSPRQLRALFSVEGLLPWRDRLPDAESLHSRVSLVVGYLVDLYHADGRNALVILLRTLGEHFYPNPEQSRHGRLLALAEQLEWSKTHTARPEVVDLEANPRHAQMLWTADVEKMLDCARSVARVDVQCFRSGQKAGASCGTGWLVAPGLALTCWHVVEALGPAESAISDADLAAQVREMLLTFDYTMAGKGLQYKVAALEYPTHQAHPLDYAVLRLTDRSDAPIADRGYLRLDPEAPLTSQTSLYIIQHPLGQPQQSIGDTYVRPSPVQDRILYKTPTEPGTSGSPVLNHINWRVVALHNGENRSHRLREGTLVQAVLRDVRRNRPDLYKEITTAQDATRNA